MTTNESNACMEVKLDIYDKRPESLKFRSWTKCRVQIEPIKCFPCFLRIIIQSLDDPMQRLSVTINVPGITVSLATSRTKLYTYGLFWTHNRHDCFIYFALETDMICRTHMKWLRKSIKNLEMHRQTVLEHRRMSRSGITAASASISVQSCQNADLLKTSKEREQSEHKSVISLLGPLPHIPPNTCLTESFNRDENNFQLSDIYEEISSSMSRCRISPRSSVASGIYEEMNSLSIAQTVTTPPLPPPLPPPRKRLYTYEAELKVIGVDIRRSNTTPESEMYKKKKYRSLLDIFNAARSKRSASVNEKHTSIFNDLVNEQKENEKPTGESIEQLHYDHHQYHKQVLMESNKRNSFSSPDLSKINLFDDEKLSDSFKSSKIQSSNDQFDDWPTAAAYIINTDNRESVESLNVSEQLSLNFNFSAQNSSSVNLLGARAAVPTTHPNDNDKVVVGHNLSGYCIMAPIREKIIDVQKKITESSTAASDVAIAESSESRDTEEVNSKKVIKTTTAVVGRAFSTNCSATTCSSSTSGYATGFYSPTTTSTIINYNYIKGGKVEGKLPILNNHYDVIHNTPRPIVTGIIGNESTIYENMEGALSVNGSNTTTLRLYENIVQSTPPTTPSIKAITQTTTLPSSSTLMNKNVTQDLYENLLAIKAGQELGQESFTINDCTSSTPTETNDLNANNNISLDKKYNNSIYHTPRRNVINMDEKVSSYYPNTTGTKKMQRNHHIRKKQTASNSPDYYLERDNNVEEQKYMKNILCAKSFNSKTIGTHLHKDNVYISSPINITGQRYQSHSNKTAVKIYTEELDKKIITIPTVQKVSENVYMVNTQRHEHSRDLNYTYTETQSPRILNSWTIDNQKLKENFHNDFNIVQNIDFKFDDPKHVVKDISDYHHHQVSETSGIENFKRAENEYEKYYIASKNAAKLLNEFAAMMPMQQKHRNLYLMTQSSSTSTSSSPSSTFVRSHGEIKTETSGTLKASILEDMTTTTKKFASLPRFKKFDLSPLRVKINNVLQRQLTPNLLTTQSSETK